MEHIILASSSPQRKYLLEGLGVRFDVVPPVSVDEEAHPELDPGKRAVMLACEKAQDIAAHRPDSWIIGCDTLVVAADGTRLEKPVDADDARRMLQLQSGRTSVVHSGLALVSPDGSVIDGLSSSYVTFRPLHDDDIEWWIRTKLWENRSGSFQIDGPGQLMIQEIKGDWSGIVGLPVYLLGEITRKAGLKLVG